MVRNEMRKEGRPLDNMLIVPLCVTRICFAQLGFRQDFDVDAVMAVVLDECDGGDGCGGV